MNETDLQPTTDPDDLEEVEIQPRGKRDAVISVRLAPSEAAALSALASRAGMSVSELTRTILRSAISTQWRVHVWGQPGPVSFIHETGGDFTRMFGETVSTRGRVRWCSAVDHSTAVS